MEILIMALIVAVPTVWLYFRIERKEQDIYESMSEIMEIIALVREERGLRVTLTGMIKEGLDEAMGTPKKKRGRPRKIKS